VKPSKASVNKVQTGSTLPAHQITNQTSCHNRQSNNKNEKHNRITSSADNSAASVLAKTQK